MKGAPKIDTSKKHGTNANYKKSGMTKDGAPFIGGMLSRIRKRPLDPLGLFGKGGKGGGNCPSPNTPVPNQTAPPPPPAGPAPTAEPAAAPVAEGATMKKDLMKPGAPNYKNPQDYKVFNMGNKPTPVKKNKKY
tara:strand:+ start:43 stop:444 length:402 start_codon:yes stop_codon:yes gene_type:complete